MCNFGPLLHFLGLFEPFHGLIECDFLFVLQYISFDQVPVFELLFFDLLFLAAIFHLLAFLLVLDLLDFGTCNASYLLLILTEHMQQITFLLLQFKLKLPYLLLLLFHFLPKLFEWIRFWVLSVIRILQINHFLSFLASMAFRIGKFDFDIDGATFDGEK